MTGRRVRPGRPQRRQAARGGRAQQPTVHDVSQLAGVSRMTVSRVIRGQGAVLPATRERVRKAIAQLGYVPDRAAGSLASRRTGFVALMLPTLVNANFAAVAHGITDALRPADYQLLIAYTNYSVSEEAHQLGKLLARRPEALILTGALRSPAASRMLRSAGIPVIEIADLPRNPIEHAVGFSNYEAGRVAARYLMARGFQRIGAIASLPAGDVIDHRGEARMQGFEDELGRCGRPVSAVLRRGHAPVGYDHGRDIAPRVLEQRLDAVFAVSDLSAVGLVMECQRRGVRVPDDLSVMGFGDFDIGREVNPPLTTVHVDFRALGTQAGLLIRELLRADSRVPARVIDVGLQVVERASVGRPPLSSTPRVFPLPHPWHPHE